MTKRLPLQSKKNGRWVVHGWTLIDEDDIQAVARWHWHLDASGYPARHTGKNGVQIHVRLHNMLLPKWKGFVVDHINGNKKDNRRINLRYLTPSQNCFNRVKKTKGVSKIKKTGRWRAYTKGKYRQIHLGVFRTRKEARARYEKERTKILNSF